MASVQPQFGDGRSQASTDEKKYWNGTLPERLRSNDHSV